MFEKGAMVVVTVMLGEDVAFFDTVEVEVSEVRFDRELIKLKKSKLLVLVAPVEVLFVIVVMVGEVVVLEKLVEVAEVVVLFIMELIKLVMLKLLVLSLELVDVVLLG